MKSFFVTLTLSVFVWFTCNAQSWVDNLPQDKLQNGELKLQDFQKAFNDYWEPYNVENGYYVENGEKIKASGWKQFKRWEWKAGFLVDGMGNFPKTSTTEEMEKYFDKYPESPKSTSGNWTNIGYNTSNGGAEGVGRVNVIAFHPSNNNIFWVGSPSGGLWKTTNSGSSWTVLTDNNTVLGVSAIAIPSNYSTSSTIYIGTGDRDGGSVWSLGGGNTHDNEGIGVLKSTDGGSTWTSSLSFTPSQKYVVYDLLFAPSSITTLYAATSNGIYETTNSGSSWSQLTTNVCTDLEFKPGNSTIFYGAFINGAYVMKFTKTGGSWSWSNPSPSLPNSSSKRTEIAVSAANSSVVYAISVNSNDGLEGIYRSTDSGGTYSQVFNGSTSGNNLLGRNCTPSTTSGLGWYDLFITVNPSNVNDVYVGGINVWRIDFSGTSPYTATLKTHWNSTCGSTVTEVHADQHCCEFQNSSTIFIGNDGGIYKSTDAGSSWTDLSNGLTINQIYRLGLSSQSGNEVIIGLQDNGTHLYSGSNWTLDGVMGGDGMECFIDPVNSNIQYGEYQNGGLMKTTDHWATSVSITNGLSGTAAWATPFVIDPNVNTTLYTGYQKVFKSTNQGSSWTQISSWTGNELRAIAVAPSISNYIYAATISSVTVTSTIYSKLYKTTNGGTTWTNITGTLPVSSGDITYITVKNNDSNTVWLTIGGFNSNAVYQTTNGGTTWTNISSGLPSIPAMSIVQNIKNTNMVELYVAMSQGVYVKYGSSNWTSFKTGLPNVFCTELEIYYDSTTPSDSKIRVATFGRGLWESDIPTADFSANTTTPASSITPVFFTDKSTNSPTTWSWSFVPNTVTYGITTNSTSQNPVVYFTNTGVYSVTLSTTNTYGTYAESKTSYIRVGVPGKWQGTTSTAWNTATNWDNHALPTSSALVSIAAGVSNSPTYTGNLSIGTQCSGISMTGNSELTVTGDLTIPSGKQISCAANATINVSGDWIGYGTFTPGTSVVKMNGTSNSSLSANVSGSGSKTTTFAGGFSPWPGSYFDVTALGGKDITVNSFDIHCSATTTVNAEVWYTIGTYVGNTNTPAVWTKLGITQTVAGQGIYNQTSFNPGATLTIPSGSTYGFYINCYSGNTGYLVFSGGSSSVSNSDVSIYSNNVAWNVSVGTGSYSNYCFNGTVYYSYITQGNLPFWDLEITKSNATVTTNGDLIIGNDLIVKPGASLTNLANTITAAGNVLLEADNTGTASFIQSTPGFSAKAEQYLTQTNFHYISAPVSNQNISTEFVNTSSNPLPSIVDFYKFDEPNNLWRNIKNASGNLNTSFETGFVVDRGYVIAYSDNSYTRTYNGFLNYSDQTVNMTKTTASGSAGWNLVGNPFPATIAANSGTNNFISDNTSVLDNTHTAVYLWNGSGYNTVNLASTATYISPGQGFFVKAANNNSTLAINTAIQKHSSSTFYKTSGIPRFTIRVQGPSGDYNETEIVFIEGTSKGLDPGYDAQKLMGNSNIALYTILVDDDGGYYAIQSLPPSIGDQNVKLGLDAWQTGLYEFDSIQIENLQNTSIYLEDKTQNTFIDLNINPTYSFSIPVTGSFQDRFELHFGSIITESEEFQAEGNTITIFSDGNKILIQNIGNHDFYGNIAIYNLAGQKLYIREISISANSSISLSANLSAGLYLLHFISDEISITEKIILK